MAPKIQDRPLAFAIPAVGSTAILPQTVAHGVTVEMRRKTEGYFIVTAQNANDRLGEVRFYVVRRHAEDDTHREGWTVERPVSARTQSFYGQYETAAQFRTEHLRGALGFTAVNVAADWITEVRFGMPAR